MIIPISELLRTRGTSCEFSICEKIENVADYPDVVDFLEPVKIEGVLSNAEDTIVLDGKGDTTVELLCSRCLSPVTILVNFTLNEKFSRAGVEDEETETYSKDVLDIADVVKRSIISVLPMKVLCQEDCLGLCPICGMKRNGENEGGASCQCDMTTFDPRFEELRTLFKINEEV